jgi:hypothetical protein
MGCMVRNSKAGGRGGERFFELLQTGPGAYPVFRTMGNGVFPGCKAARNCRYPLTSPNVEAEERVELYL